MQLPSFFSKKNAIPLWLLIGLPLLAYLGWEAYWFTQVGLNFIRWHTHFMVYVYLWLAGVFVLAFMGNKKLRQNLTLSFSVLVFMLLIIEIGLHFAGFNKTYLENRIGQYQSVFNYKSNDSLWRQKANKDIRLSTPEYDYPRHTNSFGFSDEEWVRDTSKVLLQAYGDSFTEGDGAPADSSYPAILRTLIGENYQVQNFGVCGNDPGFYVTQFGKVGSQFKPDVIALCYSTGDFTVDVFSKGGLERFTASGWQTRKGPWWEVIYGISYVSRLFFHAAGIHYNNFFLSKEEKARQLKMLQPKWNEIFEEIARLARQHNTKVLLFKKPERIEIVLNAYEYNMAFFDSFLAQHTGTFKHTDLMPFYHSRGLTNNENTTPYYWAKDQHHNSTGYAVMAASVHEALKEMWQENGNYFNSNANSFKFDTSTNVNTP